MKGQGQGTPRSGLYHGGEFASPWSQSRGAPLGPGGASVEPIHAMGSPTSRLMLNRDVKKHRLKWDVLHRCQKLFHLADGLWRLGDEQRRSMDQDVFSSHATADAHMRKAREQLMQILQEMQGGTAPVTLGETSADKELSLEKPRLRRMLVEAEEKATGLEIAYTNVTKQQDRLKSRIDYLRQNAKRGWLEAHFSASTQQVVIAWKIATIGIVGRRYKSQVMGALSRLAERTELAQADTYVETCWATWVNATSERRYREAERRRLEAAARDRAKKLKAAQMAFGHAASALLLTSIRGWETVTKNSGMNAAKRKQIMDRTTRMIAGQGWLLVRQCITEWGNIVKVNIARRQGKEKLMANALRQLGADRLQIARDAWGPWKDMVTEAKQERAQKLIDEANEAKIRARLQKLKMIESILANEGPRLKAACFKEWNDCAAVTRAANRFKQNGMDSALRRILGLQAELLRDCLNAWIEDWKEESARAKNGRIEEARRKALAHFAKSLAMNVQAVQQMTLKAWNEQVELRKLRQKKRKEIMERAAANMATAEMMVKMLFPIWVHEARNSNYAKYQKKQMQASLDRCRGMIIKLRDKTILQLCWLGWYMRAIT